MIKPRFDALGGFDGKANPKWQMVGIGGTATVFLYDGDDTDVRIIKNGIVEFSEADMRNPNYTSDEQSPKAKFRAFDIKGIMPGRTFVEVRRKNHLVEELEIVVTETIEFKVSFKFVSDNANHSAKRDKSTLAETVRLANSSLLRDVNIKIINHNEGSQDLKFDRNLGRVVMYQNVGDIIASKRDKTATFTVFFVWEYEQDNTPRHDDADAAAINRVIFFEDDAGDPPTVLIHELAHLMGLPHHFKDRNFLSYSDIRYLFTKNQVTAMRGILKRILKLAG